MGSFVRLNSWNGTVIGTIAKPEVPLAPGRILISILGYPEDHAEVECNSKDAEVRLG